jgi:hypothetical protein
MQLLLRKLFSPPIYSITVFPLLQRHTKHVSRLFAIASSSDHCVLATPQSEDGPSPASLTSGTQFTNIIIIIFFLLRMYPSILSFETINKLKLFFECGIPMPQEAGTPLLSILQIFNLCIISIAVLENVPPTQGYRKEPSFPH